MIKKLTFLFAFAVLTSAGAQQVITAWDFETSIVTPSSGTGTNSLIGTFAGPTSGTGSLTGCAQQTGTVAWQIGTAAPGTENESSGVEFLFSTAGYENIGFAYDHRTSNSGTRTTRIQYTTDGVVWNNLDVTPANYTNDCPGRGAIDNGRIDVADPSGTNVSDAWSRRRIDFSAIPACNDNPLFGIRIMAAHHANTGEFRQANNAAAIATGGTWRLDNVALSGDIILPPPAFIAFQGTHQTFDESAGTVQINVTVAASNAFDSTAELQIYSISTAGEEDAVLSSSLLTFPANSNTPQPVSITINDDLLPEQTEYLVLQLANPYNAELSNSGRYVVYIKDNDLAIPFQDNEISLQLLSSYQNGTEGTNSTEIVAHDPASQRLAVANSIGNKIDILDFSNPAQITPIQSLDISAFGDINSIAIKDGIIAAAVQFAINPQDSGYVLFMNMDGVLLNSLRVGAMPDMLTFNHAGNRVVIACEGEPNLDYSQDPEGSVCVVNLDNGIANLIQDDVVFIEFDQYNGQEEALRQLGIRIFGPGASAAQDFEPEYVTISDDDMTAWVSLQENNAVAVIDLMTGQVTQLMPLGYKDHSLPGNGMDVSDQTNAVNIANFPVRGLYMPDAIDQFTINGMTYIVTANEGDSREYTPIVESVRLSSAGYMLDPVAFPDAAALKTNTLSGRLNVLNTIGDTDGDGDFDEIYCLGSRSFSIWDAQTGALVFDSGDQLEQITSNHPQYASLFNASNSGGTATVKNRSDDKGPEPEGIVTAWIDSQLYAFIALERIGGAMVYNITDPLSPYFVTYSNNRSAATNGPDRGAEGIIFISAEDSPTGSDLVLLANEVSSTLSVFQVNSCLQLAGVLVSPSAATICQGQTVDLTAIATEGTAFQWWKDGVEIPMATANTLQTTEAGQYALTIANANIGCTATTQTVTVTVNELPQVAASATESAVCQGETTVLSASGAESYQWNAAVQNDVAFAPSASFAYVVTGTAANGCQATAEVTITVNPLPVIEVSASATEVCQGANVVLEGFGNLSFEWNQNVINGVAFAPFTTEIYTLTGTDANGCANAASVTIIVNLLPEVTASADVLSVCLGQAVTFSGGGAVSYAWTGGAEDSEPFAPAQSGDYTVTGTDLNGCQNTATINVTVLALPPVDASASVTEVCLNETVVLSGQGAATYAWDGGVEDGSAFSPQQTAEYILTGTDANGCQNTDAITVIVHLLPVVSIDASGLTTCFNDTVSLAGQGAQSYAWDNGVLDATPFAATQTTLYTVVGSDANGCTGQAQTTITVLPLPAVEAGATSEAVCQNDEVILFGSGALSYQWTDGVEDSEPFAPAATGTYTVVGTDANGCTNNAQIEIIVHDLPQPMVMFEDGELTAETFATYQWLFNGLNIAGQQAQSWEPVINGYYAVTVVDANGCTATSDQLLVIVSSVAESMATEAGIYPNPFSDELNVRLPANGLAQAELYNAEGRLVMTTVVNETTGLLNTAHLAAGFYTLRLISSEKTSVHRVIKN